MLLAGLFQTGISLNYEERTEGVLKFFIDIDGKEFLIINEDPKREKIRGLNVLH